MSTPVQTTYPDALPLPFAGVLASPNCDKVGAFNTEASAEIPFGFAVARDNTAPYDVNGNGAKLPAASTDKLLGLVIHSNAYSNGPSGFLGTTGLKPGAMMNVIRRGRIWAACEDGCSPGDRLWVRYTSAGAGKGACRASDAGGPTSIDATKKAEWQTKAAATTVAILDCDFLNS